MKTDRLLQKISVEYHDFRAFSKNLPLRCAGFRYDGHLKANDLPQ